MTYRQAIEIIYSLYPEATARYEPGQGWRILSDDDGSEFSIPLGPFRPDREQAMILAAQNFSR
jgi:hypothetical protein